MSNEDQMAEEAISEGVRAIDIPIWFRFFMGAMAAALVVGPLIFIVRYSQNPAGFVSPSDLGLVQILLVGTLLLVASVAPWRQLGLRVSKVGFVEFGQVVDAQAKENAEEFSELIARIDELEARTRTLDSIAPITEHFESNELIPLLMKFLDSNSPVAFSPSRIKEWGARQPGFEKLKDYSQGAIRRVLQKLVAQGNAATRVSRMGATLYKRPD